jgi:hypothetical protein
MPDNFNIPKGDMVYHHIVIGINPTTNETYFMDLDMSEASTRDPLHPENTNKFGYHKVPLSNNIVSITDDGSGNISISVDGPGTFNTVQGVPMVNKTYRVGGSDSLQTLGGETYLYNGHSEPNPNQLTPISLVGDIRCINPGTGGGIDIVLGVIPVDDTTS